jgi:ABC-type polar amino acid transport system ATPase subunit
MTAMAKNGQDIAIEVRGLVKYHGAARILDRVSLAVNCGEVAVILGPSGGGKSTLLRCINGLEFFNEGEVEVHGLRLSAGALTSESAALRQNLRRQAGIVFQQFHLFPHMTVLDNVLSGPLYALNRTRAAAEPEARQLLKRVGLADKLNARPDQLSGGQQQRVAIARALAMRPKAILFDEPTSALDPRMAAEVLAVMLDLAREGQTMVVVTHAIHFARRVANFVHVMDQGRIVESGPPEAVFSAPATDVTKSFLSETMAC